jgi:hypothetical protein
MIFDTLTGKYVGHVKWCREWVHEDGEYITFVHDPSGCYRMSTIWLDVRLFVLVCPD